MLVRLTICFLFAGSTVGTLAAATQSGRLVVHMDDWTHSDTGFAQAPSTGVFYENMANWFTGGFPGNFVVYSAHATFGGSAFYTQLQAAGHSVVRDTTSTPSLSFFQSFDGVFLCSGPTIDPNVLIQYVQSGGSVYVAAGTSSIPSSTADYWNPFVSAFGIELSPTLNNSCNGVRSIDGTHPLFAGVTALYYAGPQPIIDTSASDSSGRVIEFCGASGATAVYGDSVGSSVCGPAVANSSGFPAYIQAAGSLGVGDADLVLSASGLPAATTGYFLSARAQGAPVTPPGSQGRLCLSGSIGRFSGPGQIQMSGGGGAMALSIDVMMVPTPTGLVAVQPGETWLFQAWFRDANPGSTSNFTDAIELTFS